MSMGGILTGWDLTPGTVFQQIGAIVLSTKTN